MYGKPKSTLDEKSNSFYVHIGAFLQVKSISPFFIFMCVYNLVAYIYMYIAKNRNTYIYYVVSKHKETLHRYLGVFIFI